MPLPPLSARSSGRAGTRAQPLPRSTRTHASVLHRATHARASRAARPMLAGGFLAPRTFFVDAAGPREWNAGDAEGAVRLRRELSPLTQRARPSAEPLRGTAGRKMQSADAGWGVCSGTSIHGGDDSIWR